MCVTTGRRRSKFSQSAYDAKSDDDVEKSARESSKDGGGGRRRRQKHNMRVEGGRGKGNMILL